jgi:hypothetical protein
VKGLFVGSLARVTWLLPFTTIYLGVYEWSKKKLIVFKKEQVIQRRALATTPAAAASKKTK